MNMTIGLAQMNSGDDKEKNLASARMLIRELADAGAQLIMLPEHFDFIGPDDEKPQQAESLESSHTLSIISELARELGTYIHIGSFLERDADKIYNTGVVFNRSGEILATYRKIHLFDVEVPGGRSYFESKTITAGSLVSTFSIGAFTFGMATCYDLRFPELFRKLTEKGANVFLLPAAFTMQTGRDHWEVLLRARAVENQCWVAAAGQWGSSPPNNSSYGRSMVVNPWGIVTAQASDGVTTLVTDLNLQTVNDIRKTFPALEHVRKSLF